MKNILLLFAVIVCISISTADEIKFTSGQWLRNVLVTDTVDNMVTVITPTDTRHFKLTVIEEIIKAPYNSLGTIIVSNMSGQDTTSQAVVKQEINIETEYPHLKYLALSGASFLMAWDYLKTAGELEGNDGIKNLRNRKKTIGWAFLLGGIVNAYFSLQSVEVQVAPSSIGVFYNLP